jgi:LysR family glycine cleavage system transcriptional activator
MALEARDGVPTNEKNAVDACALSMYGRGMVRHMTRRRRPLNLAALRGFEASARLMSFTLAARELSLTQSSISRQVAALEQQLGQPLFVRRTRALDLTPGGHRLLNAVQQALATVDRTVDELRGEGRSSRIAVATYASFASLWLVPRLAAFQRDHPDIEIRIDAGDRFVDVDAEGVDVAIRWTRPTSVPRDAVLLLDEEVTPALAPLLLERSNVTLREPADLFALPLLGMDDALPTSMASAWARWFEFAGVSAPPPAPRLLFTFVDQSIQAAVRGQGVVLGRTPFVDDLVASGDLLTPFPRLRMPTGYRFYLLENRKTRDSPAVRAFREWIRGEFERGPARQT